MIISIEYSLKARAGYEQLGRDEDVGKTLNNLGVTYAEIDNHEKALEYYFESLTIYEEIDNPDVRTALLNNIGSSYEALEQLDSAEVGKSNQSGCEYGRPSR